MDNNTDQVTVYSYDTLATPDAAGVSFSGEAGREEPSLEVCELAIDMASLLSRTTGDSSDQILLEAARRCKCEVCRADLERCCY